MTNMILDKDDMIQNINLGADVLVDALVCDGVISKEQQKEIMPYKS